MWHVHSFFNKNNFIRTKGLILGGKKKQAKNNVRLAVPQKIRRECLEQSICDIWFSYNVK